MNKESIQHDEESWQQFQDTEEAKIAKDNADLEEGETIFSPEKGDLEEFYQREDAKIAAGEKDQKDADAIRNDLGIVN